MELERRKPDVSKPNALLLPACCCHQKVISVVLIVHVTNAWRWWNRLCTATLGGYHEPPPSNRRDFASRICSMKRTINWKIATQRESCNRTRSFHSCKATSTQCHLDPGRLVAKVYGTEHQFCEGAIFRVCVGRHQGQPPMSPLSGDIWYEKLWERCCRTESICARKAPSKRFANWYCKSASLLPVLPVDSKPSSHPKYQFPDLIWFSILCLVALVLSKFLIFNCSPTSLDQLELQKLIWLIAHLRFQASPITKGSSITLAWCKLKYMRPTSAKKIKRTCRIPRYSPRPKDWPVRL